MVRFVTDLEKWAVKLYSGTIVEVWATFYGETDGFYVFGAIVDTDEPPHDGLQIEGYSPGTPGRFTIALARIPLEAVEGVRTAPRPSDPDYGDWPPDGWTW